VLTPTGVDERLIVTSASKFAKLEKQAGQLERVMGTAAAFAGPELARMAARELAAYAVDGPCSDTMKRRFRVYARSEIEGPPHVLAALDETLGKSKPVSGRRRALGPDEFLRSGEIRIEPEGVLLVPGRKARPQNVADIREMMTLTKAVADALAAG
jgi:hypothetical protein